jgi:Protein of unknown function (DUF3352)
MSEHQPPSGAPEYLESASGGPIPPDPAPPAGRAPVHRSRRAWWIGGGVVALLGIGAGAWAALSFFQQGAQPAEALPSTTVAYLSVDLDPAGGQKIDAFRTLNKFPAFKDELGVNSVDELRHKVGDELISGAGCDGLDYSRDVDPWLGDRMAGAVVPLGNARPHVVAVVQVKDEDQARAGIAKINDCAHNADDGVVVTNGWAILAESQNVADQVAAATKDGSLADDATYRKWTQAVGDAGVVNAYASPDAGRVLAQELGGFFGTTGYATVVPDDSGDAMTEPGSAPSISGGASRLTTADDDPFTETLSGFRGGAATLRFTGDGLELAMAADGTSPQISAFTGTTGGALVGRLPDDTAAAAGISLAPGWLDQRLSAAGLLVGGDLSTADGRRALERETGLSIPKDLETLLGSGVAISVGKDIDFEAAENTAEGRGLPIAATVKGDSDAITAVLAKLRLKTDDPAFLASDSSGGVVAIGPSEAYRTHVLEGGDLGGDDTFTSVVRDSAHASAVLYVDIDALEPAITKAFAGDDAHDLANLIPLRAVGLSTWTDNGVTRLSFKVTTN